VVCVPAPSCSTYDCPSGYFLKGGPDLLLCASAPCSAADRSTCCYRSSAAPVSTALTSFVPSGETELPVESTENFDVGDIVVIVGGGNSELGVIASIGSIVLVDAMTNSYPAGSTVALYVATTVSSEVSAEQQELLELSNKLDDSEILVRELYVALAAACGGLVVMACGFVSLACFWGILRRRPSQKVALQAEADALKLDIGRLRGDLQFSSNQWNKFAHSMWRNWNKDMRSELQRLALLSWLQVVMKGRSDLLRLDKTRLEGRLRAAGRRLLERSLAPATLPWALSHAWRAWIAVHPLLAQERVARGLESAVQTLQKRVAELVAELVSQGVACRGVHPESLTNLPPRDVHPEGFTQFPSGLAAVGPVVGSPLEPHPAAPQPQDWSLLPATRSAGWLAAERPPLGLPEGPAANLAHSPAVPHDCVASGSPAPSRGSAASSHQAEPPHPQAEQPHPQPDRGRSCSSAGSQGREGAAASDPRSELSPPPRAQTSARTPADGTPCSVSRGGSAGRRLPAATDAEADHVATREAGAVQLAAQTPRSARSAGARSAGVREQDGKIGSSLRAAGQASGATSSATAPQRRLAGSRSEPPDPSEPLSEASGGASPVDIMNARTSSQCISTVQGVLSANDAETRPVSSRSSSDSARALRQSVLKVALLAASQTAAEPGMGAAAPAAHPQLAAGSAAEPAASAPLLPTASWPPYRAEYELFLGP